MYTYLEIHQKAPDKYTSPNIDNYGPIINILGELPDFNTEALVFIKKVMNLKLTGTYSNYHPSALVRRLVLRNDRLTEISAPADRFSEGSIDCWCPK